MNIIEQAAKRLEQLERAGVAVPWSAARSAPGGVVTALPTDATAGAPISAPSYAGDDVAKASTPPRPVEHPAARIRLAPKTRVTLDLDQLRAAGHLVPDQIRSEMAEQFRHLKRPLLKTARALGETAGHRGGQIMITSALPGEGKTFCSINLAMSMAMEVDTAVILVDADVVRPSVFARLGLEIRPPGMLDFLQDGAADLQSVLVETDVPKLLLMSSGQPNGRSTELLASASMDRLLTQLTEEYADHVVIFDAPPLLLTTESTVLASKVGQVLVVVETGKTTRNTVQQAFAALRNCPVVFSVLNKCDESDGGRRYGYYYG
ncbi:MAG: XrtA-associated tyrosine autokinase [Pseudomonadota bacterium]